MVTMTAVASVAASMTPMVVMVTVVVMIRFACCGSRVRRRMAGVIHVRTHTPD
ncbi:hypothetical protein CCUG62472_05010 [Mycobacteroides salmoniphilum]|uniref:Uncharacterized protein n=1 Tax=Mycobacteroides salmoniphilum TaxID=404941 RepID=A0A4R8SUR0_9MYCO|nr:hypothetical protein CCUG62472_05010 [Mycobacteroides salmoniphilum]TEA04149.1 hypothetical protein CCUG60884_03013 [Mycobacteroides salmoniphilum]